MIAVYIFISLLLGLGLWWIASAQFFRDRTFSGRKGLRQLNKWQRQEKDLWAAELMIKLTDFACRFVFLEESAKNRLELQLSRAEIPASAEQFTARKIIIFAAGGVGILACGLCRFWPGIILLCLLVLLLVMKQKEDLTEKLKAKDAAISQEMPRFVRTICRSLRTNRDILSAFQSYRKVAGPALCAELDILIASLRSGSVLQALQQFQRRIGSEDAFRLCSTLIEIDRGVDQTATLDYLADDMARAARLAMQKELSTRPAAMRRTYLPAVAVCVILILYVLVVFVMNQVNTLF